MIKLSDPFAQIIPLVLKQKIDKKEPPRGGSFLSIFEDFWDLFFWGERNLAPRCTCNQTCNQSTRHNSKVKARAAAPGNYIATFDQCCFGLKSPSGKAMQKRTKLLTNMRSLYDALNGNFCQGLHEHEPIQGSENGIRRSQHAQTYPDGLVNTICEVVLKSQHR